MTRQKVIELLKTGDFSVHYDDNGSGRIVKGKNEYGKGRTVFEFGGWGNGYCPEEVMMLAEALGGEADSV